MDKRMDFLLATTDYREKCNYKGEREMIDKIENIALLALVITIQEPTSRFIISFSVCPLNSENFSS
jgi:hypothetical protein